MIQCSRRFFEFFFTEFAGCLKPPSRDNHREVFYPRTRQLDLGVVEPRSFDQGCCKNDTFILSATLSEFKSLN